MTGLTLVFGFVHSIGFARMLTPSHERSKKDFRQAAETAPWNFKYGAVSLDTGVANLLAVFLILRFTSEESIACLRRGA